MKKLCPFRTYIALGGVTNMPCMGDKCMLWDSEIETCDLRTKPTKCAESEKQ